MKKQNALPRKIAILEFFQADHDLLIYVIRPDLPHLGIKDRAPHILRIRVDHSTVDTVVQRIRNDLQIVRTVALDDFGPRFKETLDAFYNLGEQIFTAELLALIEGFEAIYIVPFGDWNYLPLHAMKTPDGKALIDHFEVAYLPNGSMLQYLEDERTQSAFEQKPQGLFVGTDYTDESALFHNEALQIAQLSVFSSDSILLPARESGFEQFIRHAADKEVIHISSHGYFNGLDALASGVMLWNGDEWPESVLETDLASESSRFNILSAKSIFEQLQINAALVVLSGCVTGQSERRSGDELIGLSRSLLYAGAKAVIVALFPVLKNVTAHSVNTYSNSCFARFYELWLKEGQSKAAAFRSWLLDIREIPKYEHPYCWFSFIYIGKI